MREGLHKVVSSDDTIVAISTTIGHSAIGVIRVSGTESISIARRFFRPLTGSVQFNHRTAIVGKWADAGGEVIDEVIVTVFHSPHSYTGEDLLEISAHGNPGVLRGIIESACTAGARMATPGEFTLRAVTHGKMDLVQAEALKEFIDAQTDRQARRALTVLEGALSKRIRPLKSRLVDVIARLEAGIDFAEDDVEIPENHAISQTIHPVREELATLADTFGFGRILSKGLRLAIVGKPNVGKSSLFNRLVCSDRAIVTEIPGTTRDVVTETIHLRGVPLCFADTAGIREASDRIESLGVTRTLETLTESDVALVVLDGSRKLDGDDFRVLEKAGSVPHVIVINKADLPQSLEVYRLNGSRRVFVSAKTGQGFDALENEIYAAVSSKPGLSDELVLTSARQHEAVVNAVSFLDAACKALDSCVPHEMVLLNLYDGLSALDELTGEVVTEDILDRIFSTFCIGK
jgi:tRNA modification GTPase